MPDRGMWVQGTDTELGTARKEILWSTESYWLFVPFTMCQILWSDHKEIIWTLKIGFFIISFPPTYVINFCSRYPLLHLHSLCVSARIRRQRHIKLHFNSTVLDCRWTVEYYLNLYVLLSCIEPQEQLPRLDICNRSCIAQPSVTDTSTGWTKTVDPDHQVRFRIQRHHFILIYKHTYTGGSENI